jgi:TPR repeat protein
MVGQYFKQLTLILTLTTGLISVPAEVFSAETSEATITAREWIKKAAKQGSPDAQLILGRMYYYGKEIQKDYNAAAVWLEKAAAQGEPTAQYILGLMYYIGRGVERDSSIAALWLKNAAEQEIPEAQLTLGRIYYYGKGVTVNYKSAGIWLEKASAQGIDKAKYLLKRINKRKHPIPRQCGLTRLHNVSGANPSQVTADNGHVSTLASDSVRAPPVKIMCSSEDGRNPAG